MVDNLQLFVDKVHIRYEDDRTNPGVCPCTFPSAVDALTICCSLCAVQRPFCVGITLESLHAQSTDEDWNPTFLKTNEQIIHKVGRFCSLSSLVPPTACLRVTCNSGTAGIAQELCYLLELRRLLRGREQHAGVARQAGRIGTPALWISHSSSSSERGLTGPALDVSTRTACAQAPLHHATHHQRVEGTLQVAGTSCSPQLAHRSSRFHPLGVAEQGRGAEHGHPQDHPQLHVRPTGAGARAKPVPGRHGHDRRLCTLFAQCSCTAPSSFLALFAVASAAVIGPDSSAASKDQTSANGDQESSRVVAVREYVGPCPPPQSLFLTLASYSLTHGVTSSRRYPAGRA